MNEDVLSFLEFGDNGIQKMLVDSEDIHIAKLILFLDGPMLRTEQRHLVPVLIFNCQHFLEDVNK